MPSLSLPPLSRIRLVGVLSATAALGLALMAAALASGALLAKLLRSPAPLADRIETS